MANQAVKEASTRQRKARIIYTTLAIVLNILYFIGRYLLWDDPIEYFSLIELLGLALYGGLWYYSIQTIINSFGIGSNRNKDDLDLDKFEPLVLAILIMLIQIYTGSNWVYYITLLIPIKFLYGLYSGMSNLTVNKAAQHAQALQQEKLNAAAEKANDKRERQQQRGMKQRVFTK